MQSKITRRAAMTGSAAGAAAIAATGTIPAQAATAPDPIFAAIAAHRAAGQRYSRACAINSRLEGEIPQKRRRTWITAWKNKIVKTDDPRWIESELECRASMNAATDTAWAIVLNPPTTTAGDAALVAYVDDEDVHHSWFPEAAREAIIRMAIKAAMRRTEGGQS